MKKNQRGFFQEGEKISNIDRFDSKKGKEKCEDKIKSDLFILWKETCESVRSVIKISFCYRIIFNILILFRHVSNLTLRFEVVPSVESS